MKQRPLLYIAAVTAIAANLVFPFRISAAPQDDQLVTNQNISHASQAVPAQRYMLTLSEYRLKDIDPAKLTDATLASAIKAQKARPVETVMLSATAGTESRVQFGRSITVTTGRMTSRDVTTRQTQEREIGTILAVTAAPGEDNVKVTLMYEASRLASEGTDDSPPEMTTISVETTQMLDLGQPTLIGGSTSGETSYIFLTISQR